VLDGALRWPRHLGRLERESVMTVVVLLGAPGAGKGTQAKVLEQRLGIPHLASGDLLRAAVAARTAVGVEADRYMSRGQLVPDPTIIRVFLDRLAKPDADRGAILDGFPRTRHQAEVLDRDLAAEARAVDRAVLIDVPIDDLVRRAAGRRICESAGHVYHETANPPRVPGRCDIDGSALIQRADDREETVRARMDQQLGALDDVVDHYRTAGKLSRVDGRKAIDAVSEDVIAALRPSGVA
jgi:adenylate kinase